MSGSARDPIDIKQSYSYLQIEKMFRGLKIELKKGFLGLS